MAEINVGAADRIIRKSGTLRVSADARFALSELLEHIGSEISRRAGEIAAADKRKIIQAGDIQKARKEIWD